MNSSGPGRRVPEGSRPLGEGDGGGRRKRGLLWVLLGLIALLILAGVLIALFSGGGDEDSTSSGTRPPATDTGTSPSATAGSAAPGGSFTSGSASWTPGEALIADSTGDDAEGSGLKVQEVVDGRGFWVGTDATKRGYVELGSQAGETESDALPEVGDSVQVSGPVRPAPQDPEQTLGLDASGAKQVTDQGAYVNADEVTVR